ncbi:MAG: DUF1003 domain-containing protein [Gemmataceae bacterium]
MASKSSLRDITERTVDLIAQMEKAAHEQRTTGERVADFVASWVGSWAFLIVQSVMLVAWMALNLIGWWNQWDPYPFVLLNLVLSFQAAYATPIILMSQNRQGRLSDLRNHLDLQINLLAEQENTEMLRLLHMLCDKAGIQTRPAQEQCLEEKTKPQEIAKQLSNALEVEANNKAKASK